MTNKEQNLNGKKLIVLEDDEINIYLLKALLEKTQSDTVYCKTVDEFLDVYKGKKDVILLDIRVPGSKDGIDLLKEIRETDVSVPIIMQSAYIERKAECTAAGADEFISKPDVVEDLLPTIRKLLNKIKNNEG